jgi:hypothetical protein
VPLTSILAATPDARLIGGLVAVATVGDEDELVGQDEESRRRTGEAGEVPDVGEPGDEQGVAPGIGELLAQPPGAPGDVHGDHPRRCFTASTART